MQLLTLIGSICSIVLLGLILGLLAKDRYDTWQASKKFR